MIQHRFLHLAKAIELTVFSEGLSHCLDSRLSTFDGRILRDHFVWAQHGATGLQRHFSASGALQTAWGFGDPSALLRNPWLCGATPQSRSWWQWSQTTSGTRLWAISWAWVRSGGVWLAWVIEGLSTCACVPCVPLRFDKRRLAGAMMVNLHSSGKQAAKQELAEQLLEDSQLTRLWLWTCLSGFLLVAVRSNV